VPVSLTQKRVMLQPVGDDETSFSALHGVYGPVVGDVTAASLRRRLDVLS